MYCGRSSSVEATYRPPRRGQSKGQIPSIAEPSGGFGKQGVMEAHARCRHLLEHARNLPPGVALVLGCTDGADVVWLAERGWRVTTLDADQRALERARRRAGEAGVADRTSWRLMERVGMRREIYAVRESLHRSGAWLDGLGYALLADEWNQPQPTG